MTHYFLFSFLKLLENAWYQQKAGIPDKAQWLGRETLLRKYYHSDGVCRYGGRVASPRIRQNSKSSFQKQSRRSSSAT